MQAEAAPVTRQDQVIDDVLSQNTWGQVLHYDI